MHRVLVGLVVFAMSFWTCVAVGAAGASAGASALQPDGGWAVLPTPNPAGSPLVRLLSALAAVSCTSTRRCVAVGYTDSVSSNTVVRSTLAETWDGHAWSLQSTPDPFGAPESLLVAVSCTSPRACVAVGSSNTAGNDGTVTLAEIWDGMTWTIEPTPNPTGAKYSLLTGVSCASKNSCVAVGFSISPGSASAALSEVWDGTRWAVEPTVSRGSVGDRLFGVSCRTKRFCVAVGLSAPNNGTSPAETTLAEVWDGRVWTVRRTPNPVGAQSSHLVSVSCTSRTSCTAGGATSVVSNGSSTSPLVEHWDGRAWTFEPIPKPTGSPQSELAQVSCSSKKACTAVGFWTTSDLRSTQTLAEHWDGDTWTVQPTPSPAQSSYLSGLSCVSSRVCTAVGNSTTTVTDPSDPDAPDLVVTSTLAERHA